MKILIKMLFGLGLLFGTPILLLYLTESFWSLLVGLGIGFVLLILFLKRDASKLEEKLVDRAAQLGVNPEYVAGYEDNGIVIDNTNSKIFAGYTKEGKGKVFSYTDISSIEWENKTFGEHVKYNINIKTTDFDMPSVTVFFAGNRERRDQAYDKLRAALGIS